MKTTIISIIKSIIKITSILFSKVSKNTTDSAIDKNDEKEEAITEIDNSVRDSDKQADDKSNEDNFIVLEKENDNNTEEMKDITHIEDDKNSNDTKTLSCIYMTPEEIYHFLLINGLTREGACGLLGNLEAESGLRANNLQNTYNNKFNISDEEYTESVDNGSCSKETFINDKAGYGLAQWTFWSRKQGLYEYAQLTSSSIGCTKIQCEYLIKELESSFKKVIAFLRETNSVEEASNVVLLEFERPANQSAEQRTKRINMSMAWYDKFCK